MNVAVQRRRHSIQVGELPVVPIMLESDVQGDARDRNLRQYDRDETGQSDSAER
jgi:hypothetical protein